MDEANERNDRLEAKPTGQREKRKLLVRNLDVENNEESEMGRGGWTRGGRVAA